MDVEARNKLFQQIFQLAYDEVAPLHQCIPAEHDFRL